MNMPADAPGAVVPEDERTALNKEALKHAFLDNLFYIQGKFPALATKTDYYMALAYAVRDRMLQRWISTAAAYTKQGSRTVAYLSAEFLMGPHLGNNLINLGIYAEAQRRSPSWASTSTSCCSTRMSRGSATAAWAARRVLHRFAGDARSPGARLRHPLRVRHLPAGDRRRLAGREDRQVAALRQPVGDRAARVGCRSEVRRPHRALDRRVRPQARALGARSASSTASPTTRPSSATTSTRRTRCACGAPRRPSRSTSAIFNRGDYYGAVNQKVV